MKNAGDAGVLPAVLVEANEDVLREGKSAPSATVRTDRVPADHASKALLERWTLCRPPGLSVARYSSHVAGRETYGFAPFRSGQR